MLGQASEKFSGCEEQPFSEGMHNVNMLVNRSIENFVDFFFHLFYEELKI